MRDIFLDVEATGLDAESSQLIAIGVLTDAGMKEVYFANKPEDEKKIIEEFLTFLTAESFKIITFYGSYYDVPYIVSRALKLKVDSKLLSRLLPFSQIDVYDVVKNVLKLRKNSLSDVCRFLEISRKKTLQGRDMPNIYLKAISGDEEKKKEIISHLEEDLKVLKEVWDRLKTLIEIERWGK